MAGAFSHTRQWTSKMLPFLLSSVLLSTPSYGQPQKARLNHLAIFVQNLAKSEQFYRQVIGLDTIDDPFKDGKHRWLAAGPGQSIHIIEGAAQPKQYFKNHHICFSVPSVETFTQLLRAWNISWEDVQGRPYAITYRVDGVKQIWLKDPDGYWVEINDASD